MISAKEYKVQPQVKVGKYQIDFVIEGIRELLADECDGERWEEDMQRQYDLESAFHFYPRRMRKASSKTNFCTTGYNPSNK